MSNHSCEVCDRSGVETIYAWGLYHCSSCLEEVLADVNPEEHDCPESKLTHDALALKCRALEAMCKKQAEALMFYGNKENWLTESTGFAAQYDPKPSAIERDEGKLARELLEELSE